VTYILSSIRYFTGKSGGEHWNCSQLRISDGIRD